jgi:pyruvate,water dikinase
LARELGIPTVAQVRNATGILKNGQRLVVNGTKGTVVVDG